MYYLVLAILLWAASIFLGWRLVRSGRAKAAECYVACIIFGPGGLLFVAGFALTKPRAEPPSQYELRNRSRR